jgi:hypothetical protein
MSALLLEREIRETFGEAGQFHVSVCTVSGQLINVSMEHGGGHASAAKRRFPIMEMCKPLLYALALKDVGHASVHKVRTCLFKFL